MCCLDEISFLDNHRLAADRNAEALSQSCLFSAKKLIVVKYSEKLKIDVLLKESVL